MLQHRCLLTEIVPSDMPFNRERFEGSISDISPMELVIALNARKPKHVLFCTLVMTS